MGFITNTFIKGGRAWQPVEVDMKTLPRFDDWDERHNVFRELELTRADGYHQRILFTPEDLHNILPSLLEGAYGDTAEKIAEDFLASLGDTALFNFLVKLLSPRSDTELLNFLAELLARHGAAKPHEPTLGDTGVSKH